MHSQEAGLFFQPPPPILHWKFYLDWFKLKWRSVNGYRVAKWKLTRPFEPPRLKVTHAVWELKMFAHQYIYPRVFFWCCMMIISSLGVCNKKKTLWSKLSFSVSFYPHFSVEIGICWRLSISCCWWTNKHIKVHQFSITPLSTLLSPNCT